MFPYLILWSQFFLETSEKSSCFVAVVRVEIGRAHSCCCLGLLLLAPSTAEPRAGCLFHILVTPGKSYGLARKKLFQQCQQLGGKQIGQ